MFSPCIIIFSTLAFITSTKHLFVRKRRVSRETLMFDASCVLIAGYTMEATSNSLHLYFRLSKFWDSNVSTLELVPGKTLYGYIYSKPLFKKILVFKYVLLNICIRKSSFLFSCSLFCLVLIVFPSRASETCFIAKWWYKYRNNGIPYFSEEVNLFGIETKWKRCG